MGDMKTEPNPRPLRRVILESPFAGDETVNRAYLKACLRDSLLRGEAPVASHALYPGALRDDVPEERELGMLAGFAWHPYARAVVIYTDLGISPGMARGMENAQKAGRTLEFRSLPEWDAWKKGNFKRGQREGYAAAERHLRRELSERGLDRFDLPLNPFPAGPEYPGAKHL